MYVSITGLKATNLMGWIRFWVLTIPAFKAGQGAAGNLFCEAKGRNGWQHTLTVWQTKEDMLAYKRSPKHIKAMKVFSQIADGKVYGYESETMPSWDEAFIKYDESARDV